MSLLFPTEEEIKSWSKEKQEKFWKAMNRVDELADERKKIMPYETEYSETDVILQQVNGMR